MHDADTAYSRSLAGLAGLLLAKAITGPVGLGLVSYPLPESLLNQLRGLERQQALGAGVDTAETGIGPAEPHVRT
jgi:hypothetical protein